MTQYMTTAGTAKMVRRALNEAFPGVKFSVRSHTYAGGSSIDVYWMDGPNAAMVESVAGTFSGAYFDGMIDYKGSTRSMIDGVVTQFGADFIFVHRKTSYAFLEAVMAAAVRRYGALVAGVQVRYGQGYAYLDGGDYEAIRLCREIANKRSAYLSPRKSRTAGKVIYLGNDGYSQTGALSGDAA